MIKYGLLGDLDHVYNNRGDWLWGLLKFSYFSQFLYKCKTILKTLFLNRKQVNNLNVVHNMIPFWFKTLKLQQLCKKMDKNWGKWDKDFKIKIGATLKSIVIEQDDNN